MELFNDVDINEPGEWPLPLKVLAAVGLCIVIWGAGFHFVINDKMKNLKKIEQEEQTLKQTFEQKQAKAVNLEAYKKQMAEMRVTFSSMLKQLPRQSEVADLLVDITRTGLINGLEFELFQPSAERPVEFYAELPIQMSVTGTYHQLGKFVSGLAALPRIVTIHNIKLKPLSGNTNKLRMNVSAKTYRYFDENNN
jgi:type IV pilus assembly protein PilO